MDASNLPEPIPNLAAGLLMYRLRAERVEVLLAHPGGPYWQGKDRGAWTLPKGGVFRGEELLQAAIREFTEETGLRVTGDLLSLGAIRQRSGKVVHAWAFEGDCDPDATTSNTFEMEWPKHSGHMRSYPEIDRCAWFGPEQVTYRMHKTQVELVRRLVRALQVQGRIPEGSFPEENS